MVGGRAGKRHGVARVINLAVMDEDAARDPFGTQRRGQA
jgi:hypothetical protein